MTKKLIYFVIGVPGSGKTVLSNQLANQTKGESKVFDDFHFIFKPEQKYKIENEVAKVRHTGKTIFINTTSTNYLKASWNVRVNPYVTWIFTGLSFEQARVLISQGYRRSYINKLYKAWRNIMKHKRDYKTRPYLSITTKPTNDKVLVYEYHRYKRSPITKLADGNEESKHE